MLNIAIFDVPRWKCVTFNQAISCRNSEAATWGVMQEKVFLEISQNLHENTRARVSFLVMFQASGLQLY